MDTINETNMGHEVKELSYEELQKVVGGLVNRSYSTAVTDKSNRVVSPIRSF